MNSLGHKSSLKKQTFGKKGSLSCEKNLLAFFSRSIQLDKYQGTLYKGPQGNLTFTVDVITSIL